MSFAKSMLFEFESYVILNTPKTVSLEIWSNYSFESYVILNTPKTYKLAYHPSP